MAPAFSATLVARPTVEIFFGFKGSLAASQGYFVVINERLERVDTLESSTGLILQNKLPLYRALDLAT